MFKKLSETTRSDMKSKRILKFYFFAESLNSALDNLIQKFAVDSSDFTRGGDYYAEKICEIVEEKGKLGELWNYLDKVMCAFTVCEKKVLRFYGATRRGISSFTEDERREIKRVTVKFGRHAKGLERFKDGVGLVGKYYCLLHA